ncbi:MAG: ABC transporter substrate-binding protein [Actinomycetota bacterium]
MGSPSRLVPLVAALALLLAACADGAPATGGPPGTPSSSASSAFPVTVHAAGGAVTVPSRPERIVSLSPTATEMLFAIGAGDQVVAVDDQSNYPPDAPTTKLSGYEPNAESIASYDPDLVVYANDLGDVRSALDDLGIPALLQPAAAGLHDVYDQIEELGAVTGNESGAGKLVSTMRSQIAAIVAAVPKPPHALTYYQELDDTYYSVTSSTFIGKLYSLLGLRNIADAADKGGSGYPQLSPEYIISANPDLIFLADTKCCGQSRATVEKRPGWDGIAAVRNGGVIPLDDDVASRWGPRIVDFLRAIAHAVTGVEDRAA